MKKLYTLLGAALIAGSLSAQTVYESQDFETSLAGNGWTTQLPTLNDTTDWVQATFSGNSYAMISNYYSTPAVNVPAEAWLISPAINLTGATTPMLNFQTVMKYPGAALTLYVSTDYDGTSDPTQQGTWTDLTSLATWDTDNAAWGSFSSQGSGDIDLTSYISSATYVAFKYTGSATDGSTWEVDNINVVEGGGSVGTDASVYDIQYTTASPADSPYMGQTVNTGGIVTHVRTDGYFYIKSGSGPYTSVYVFDATQTVAVGDSVTFTADVDEFFELTELKNLSNFVVVSSGNFFMSNTVSTSEANSEAYESALVRVSGNVTAAPDSFNEYPINDGSGDVLVDDFFIGASNFVAPTVGNCYTITGIVDFSYGAFKVLPRNSADISTACLAGVEENAAAYSLYPNPANDNITIQVEGTHLLNITDISGKVVEVMNVSGTSNISLDNYNAGIYFFNIEGNVTKVIVK